jgi:GNAT superfamily N-acetyltransferase
VSEPEPVIELVEIRLATPADIVPLAALRRQVRKTTDDPGFERRFAEWFAAEGDRRTTWIAEQPGAGGSRPIGCASLVEYRRMPAPDRPDAAWGYLGNMFVVEGLRDAGVGSALLAAVLAAADYRGYVRVVLAPSERSIPFYRRAGFIDAGADAASDRLMVRPAH